MILAKMTRTERALLLYLETRLVDYRGFADPAHMSSEDIEIGRKWARTGFVELKRASKKSPLGIELGYEIKFSDEAWKLAHEERIQRAERMKNA